MSCESHNHQAVHIAMAAIAGCKLPTALAMNIISILIFPRNKPYYYNLWVSCSFQVHFIPSDVFL